jgi:Flp pilus assembly protein TadG
MGRPAPSVRGLVIHLQVLAETVDPSRSGEPSRLPFLPAGTHGSSSSCARADDDGVHDMTRLGSSPLGLGSRARRGGRCSGDSGAAMVELGLIMPIVMAIGLATVTSGVAIEQRLNLDLGVRESARYGATLASSQTFVNERSWASNVRDVAVDRSAGDLEVPGATVCVSLVEGSGTGGVYVISGPFAQAAYTTKSDGKPCDPDETYPVTLYDVGRRVQVRVTRPSYIETGLARWTIELTSTATVKSESVG